MFLNVLLKQFTMHDTNLQYLNKPNGKFSLRLQVKNFCWKTNHSNLLIDASRGCFLHCYKSDGRFFPHNRNNAKNQGLLSVFSFSISNEVSPCARNTEFLIELEFETSVFSVRNMISANKRICHLLKLWKF